MHRLDDFERIAQEKLPRDRYEYFAGGADDELTLGRNRSAFDSLLILPRVLRGGDRVETGLRLFGAPLSYPVVIAPTAFQKLAHPEGELATTRAARKAGTVHIVSTAASASVEAIAEEWEGAPSRGLWFQLAVQKDWDVTLDLVKRAERANYGALVVSVDAPVYGKRLASLRNGFRLPPDIRLENFRYAPEVLDPFTYRESLSWDDIARIRDATKLPILLKGILSPVDARCAVEYGADGIVVSNHGGRQLDSVPAPIEMLGPIIETVGRRIPVLLDGGVRRGTDVVKALALGATAVGIGRPILWGLVAGGEDGVRAVLEILREELVRAMRLCGVISLSELSPDFVRRA